MTALLDEIDFADRLERLQLVAASRGLLRDLRAFGTPLRSRLLRESVPLRFYATRGSSMRSPALICAEAGEPEVMHV